MARKTCSISSREKAASDKAALNALDGALRSGTSAILNRMADRSHRVMAAWVAAGRPNTKAAIARALGEVDAK